MRRLRLFMFILASWLLFSCEERLIDVKDKSFRAELEVLTPTVGYGDDFKAKLYVSEKEFTVSEFQCPFTMKMDSKDIEKYGSYRCNDSVMDVTIDEVMVETNQDVEIVLTLRSNETGSEVTVRASFTAVSELVAIPGSVVPSVSELNLSPGDDKSTVDLTFAPADSNTEYEVTYDRDDWNRVITVTQEDGRIHIQAPKNSIGGTVVMTVSSSYNQFVNCSITVRVKKNVALVITGTTCGDKPRVTWNQYQSYRFTSLYCYIAEWEGDLEKIMLSNSKDASSLSFKTSQSSFDYNVEFCVSRFKGSSLSNAEFPYKCLSNAHMQLSEVSSTINYENDRKTRDHDTAQQYYTLKVSKLTWKSEQYNIKYIVHLYKAKKDGHWITCSTFTKGYDLEKNKYWYAAADTDEWIIEWR